MVALRDRNPFRVGLVAIAAVVALAVAVVVISVVPFGKSTYTAVLENTAGLRSGEDVEVHGVPVGKVTDVALDGHTVLVTFTLDKKLSLGRDTTAAVKVATLLGTHYLEVDPSGGGSLADGRIALDHTSVPYNLQDVLETGTRKLNELNPVKLAKALTAVSRTLDPASDQIGPALVGVGRLSQLVIDRSDQTGALLTEAQRVTGQLAGSSTDLIGLMRQTNLVVSEVTKRRAAIRRLLVQATELARALRTLVRQSETDLGPALSDINAALTSLRRQDANLRHTLTIIAPAARYVANATGNGPFVDLYGQAPALVPDNVQCRMTGDC